MENSIFSVVLAEASTLSTVRKGYVNVSTPILKIMVFVKKTYSLKINQANKNYGKVEKWEKKQIETNVKLF